MGYIHTRVVVIDERHSSFSDESTTPEDVHNVEQADIVIWLKPDGIHASSNMVDIVTPRTEAELSHQKAVDDLARREAKRKQDPPPRDALKKAYRALGVSEDFEAPPLP